MEYHPWSERKSLQQTLMLKHQSHHHYHHPSHRFASIVQRSHPLPAVYKFSRHKSKRTMAVEVDGPLKARSF